MFEIEINNCQVNCFDAKQQALEQRALPSATMRACWFSAKTHVLTADNADSYMTVELNRDIDCQKSSDFDHTLVQTSSDFDTFEICQVCHFCLVRFCVDFCANRRTANTIK